MRALALPVVCAATALAVLVGVPGSAPPEVQAASCSGARASTTKATIAQSRRAILCLINQERSQRGLPRLRDSDRLENAADKHSEDMVDRRYFSHVSPGGQDLTDRAKKSGYLSGRRAWALAENLSWATRERATPEATVRLWMESPKHRRNILNGRYRDGGIGIASGTPKRRAGATFTLMLGWRG